MRRAKVSTPPPGDTGTTMRIGRLGTSEMKNSAARAFVMRRRRRLLLIRTVPQIVYPCLPSGKPDIEPTPPNDRLWTLTGHRRGEGREPFDALPGDPASCEIN